MEREGHPTTVLRVRLFGDVVTATTEEWRAVPGTARDHACIATVLLTATTPISRARLAEECWPDLSPTAARNRLRHALYQLRSLFSEGEAPCLRADRDTVQWVRDSSVWVDALAFRDTLTPLRSGRAPRAPLAIATVETVVALYRGDLAPACDTPTIAAERESLRALYLTALEWLIDAHATAGDLPRALAVARQLIAYDPLRETSHRLLMTTAARLGDRASAVRQFAVARDLLRDQLGVAPSPETVALAAEIGRHAAAPLSLTAERALAPPSTPPRRRALAVPSTPRIGVAPLVGRQDVLGRLREAWQRARNGQSGLALLAGESGIGKSRLLAELSEACDDAIVLVGRAVETERLTAYYPVAEAFRHYLSASEGGVPAPLLSVDRLWLAELARIVPEIAPAAPRPDSDDGPGFDRLRLFEGLTRCLLAIATRPTLLVMDDLQWADESTLTWLERVTTRMEGARLLIAGAYRIEEPSPALTGFRARLLRNGWDGEIRVAPLTEAELTTLLDRLAGDAEVVRRLGRRLAEGSGGNPLFVLEMARTLVETGTVQQHDGIWRIAPQIGPAEIARLPIPTSIAEVIGARLDRLSDDARAIAAAAATLGRTFAVDDVIAVSGLDDDAALDGLEALASATIIAEAPAEGHGGPPRYTFSHDIVREALVQRTSAARQQRLHSRAGDILRRKQTDELVAAIGQHYLAAGLPSDAAPYLLQAAEASRKTFAYVEAIARYRQTIAALSSLTDPAARGQRVDVRLRLALTAWYSEPGSLPEVLAAAETDARAHGDPTLLTQVQLAQAGALYITGRFPEAEALLPTVVESATALGDDTTAARAEHLLGRIDVLRGSSARGRQRLIRLLQADDTKMTPSGAIISRALAAAAAAILGDRSTADRELAETIARAETLGDAVTVAAARVVEQAVAVYFHEWQRAIAIGRDAAVIAREGGNRVYEYHALAMLGLPLAQRGDVAGGIETLQRAIAIAEHWDSRLLLARCYAWLAEALLLANKPMDALAAARRSVGLAEEQANLQDLAFARRAVGLVALHRGMLADAERALTAAAQIAETIAAPMEQVRALTALARVAERRGDNATAEHRHDAITAIRARLGGSPSGRDR